MGEWKLGDEYGLVREEGTGSQEKEFFTNKKLMH
jgi:hypothetical protein